MQSMEKPYLKNSPSNAERIFRYLVSGGVACISNFCLLALLVQVLNVNSTLSSGISFFFGGFVNYIMQYYWTFQSNGRHLIVFTKFIFVITCTMSLNVLLFSFFTKTLGIWYLYSQFFALTCVLPLNYIINRFYTFRI